MSRNISLPEEIVRLAEKGPDATLPKGTTMETILDRDISFTQTIRSVPVPVRGGVG